MTDHDPLDLLKTIEPPSPREAARREALARAMDEFDNPKNSVSLTQGQGLLARLISGTNNWREAMSTKQFAGQALATLLIVPLAGLATWSIIETQQWTLKGSTAAYVPAPAAVGETKLSAEQAPASPASELDQPVAAPVPELDQLSDGQMSQLQMHAEPAPALAGKGAPAQRQMLQASPGRMANETVAPVLAPMPEPVPMAEPNRDRVQEFSTNPVKRVAEEPVSTFSIDVDTASYSFVRRALKAGHMPERDSVRVEELVNYFPYDWPAPDNAQTPFKASVTVTPTPWNQHTRLMHVAIKGYEIAAAQKPRTNLVFLVDTSGSMQDADKLPLLKASLRLLLDRLGPDDSVALVTYAGEAGVALEPTKAGEKAKILDAIERLGAGGSTAGAAGIEEAYRLAQSNYVEGGVNRVMLATDGDFNVGPSDDEALKRLIEEKRKSGVFLSVLGFGEGNYNDQLMQVIAQNGNGTASYIDTLAEAEKTLVQEAGSTLFPIAKDVKIQVEFNPQSVSEYRLIGYETRALNREDFNNDRIDAGEIGSGHAVTAIYELTPKGSPALSVDALRYGAAEGAQAPAPGAEMAYVKIRYKEPTGETSQLISQPVGEANAIADLASAPQDVRFSIAVAAFGQKLRGTDALSGFSYDAIGKLAANARGDDPFGYRSEFTTLVRLAGGLER